MRGHKTRISASGFWALPVLVFSGLLAGCPSENPALVQPPDSVDSMVVMLLSVVPDGVVRQVEMGDTAIELRPGERTSLFLMNRDSLRLRLFRLGQQTGQFPLRLLRRMRHLVVITSRQGRDTCAVFLQPLDISPQETIRLLHVADDEALYGLQLGCAQIPPTSGWVGPLLESGPLSLPVGRNVVLSILRLSGTQHQLLGSWELASGEGSSRSLVVWGSQGDIRVGVLEEEQVAPRKLVEPPRLVHATSAVRLLNLSREPLTLFHLPGGAVVATGIVPRSVGAYTDVPVCREVMGDTFLVRSASGRTVLLVGGLEPFRRYTVVVADSGEQLWGWFGTTDGTVSGKAQARLLHAAFHIPTVRVVLGAMGTGQVQSGRVVAEGFSFGSVTDVQEFPLGNVPLMVQTVQLPSFFPAAAFLECVPGVSGLLCLLPEPAWYSGLGIAWVDDRAENEAVRLLSEGAPVQLMQGVPGPPLRVSFLPALVEVGIPYRTVLATAIPREGTSLRIGAREWRIHMPADSIGLLVAIPGADVELFCFSSPRRWEGPWGAQRRFINASDVAAVDVVIDTVVSGQRSEVVRISALARGAASFFELLPVEYRFSFRIRDSQTRNVLARVDNILLPLGGRFSIIFAGTRADGYVVLVHQEL